MHFSISCFSSLLPFKTMCLKYSENTLLKLMIPPKELSASTRALYTSFAWRNIYLYIAKNPSATKKIKDYILSYPNARPMDIEAALH